VDGADQVESDVPATRLTVEEAMAFVVDRLKEGDLDEAETICRKILEVAPDYPASLHYLGMLEHQRGRDDEAVALVTRSLELVPDQADWHSNLGILLQVRGDLSAAAREFEHAIALCPTHANAHNNLGVLLRVAGRLDESEKAYREAIALDPEYADAYSNLAILLGIVGRTPEAVTAYCKALSLKPELPGARQMLVIAYCQIGERDKALATCEQWIKDSPDDPVAQHVLAAVSERDVPPRASDDYIQKTFDSFSRNFEAKLARLDYRAPQLVVDSLVASGATGERTMDILDAGCGTGLCGPLLAPYARRLTGVDLSSGMLQHARAKNVYDDLTHGELTAYLTNCDEEFDAIVTADTLVYFGGLEAVAHAAAGALRPGGLMIFTVEESVDPARTDPYMIQPHGRFCHRVEYVEGVLRDAGLEPHIDRGELRKESGLPVPGLIVRATKTSAPAAGARHA
jgi:predicted TPR repeat methyltransferase